MRKLDNSKIMEEKTLRTCPTFYTDRLSVATCSNVSSEMGTAPTGSVHNFVLLKSCIATTASFIIYHFTMAVVGSPVRFWYISIKQLYSATLTIYYMKLNILFLLKYNLLLNIRPLALWQYMGMLYVAFFIEHLI